MFTLELWPGVTLTGRIDRIDRAADGRWRVVDYKTGEKAAAPEAAHRARARPDTPDYARCAADGRRWTDLQLPLYAWALQSGAVAGLDRPAALPRCGYFNLPGELDDVGWQPWPEEKWNDELVADAWACARRVAENIRAGVFWPPQHAASDYDFVELLGADPLTRVDPRNLNGAAGRTA